MPDRGPFVRVARQVWEDSSGTIAPREAGHKRVYIPFSPVGTKRNLADSTPGRGKIRFAFKIPHDLLRTIDPEEGGRTALLSAGQGRRAPFNRTFEFRNPEDAAFVAELILACVLDPGDREKPPAAPKSEASTEHGLDLQGNLGAWWKESEDAFRAQFWRLCIVLCAGIIEGRLREVLEQPGSAGSQEPPRDVIDLLKAARNRGTLGAETVGKCHAVRMLRNRAVHPPRFGDPWPVFTREVAEIARDVVEECHQELTGTDSRGA